MVDHPRSVVDGCCYVLKLWLDRIYSFGDSAIFRFSRFGFKLHLIPDFTWVEFLSERDYVTFGSLLSPIRFSSVVCLSFVTLVHPTQAVEPFVLYFFTGVYISHTRTSVQTFLEIAEGEPLYPMR